MKEQVPKLYLYIYRNFRDISPVVTDKQIFFAIRKVTYKCPQAVMRSILKELEELKLIEKIADGRYKVIRNSQLDTKLRELSEFVFPIDCS